MMNQPISDEGVCRTAPATPGLLIDDILPNLQACQPPAPLSLHARDRKDADPSLASNLPTCHWLRQGSVYGTQLHNPGKGFRKQFCHDQDCHFAVIHLWWICMSCDPSLKDPPGLWSIWSTWALMDPSCVVMTTLGHWGSPLLCFATDR